MLFCLFSVQDVSEALICEDWHFKTWVLGKAISAVKIYQKCETVGKNLLLSFCWLWCSVLTTATALFLPGPISVEPPLPPGHTPHSSTLTKPHISSFSGFSWTCRLFEILPKPEPSSVERSLDSVMWSWHILHVSINKHNLLYGSLISHSHVAHPGILSHTDSSQRNILTVNNSCAGILTVNNSCVNILIVNRSCVDILLIPKSCMDLCTDIHENIIHLIVGWYVKSQHNLFSF